MYELAHLQTSISLILMGGSLLIGRNIFNQDSDIYCIIEFSVTSVLPSSHSLVTFIKCNKINLSEIQDTKCGNNYQEILKLEMNLPFVSTCACGKEKVA